MAAETAARKNLTPTILLVLVCACACECVCALNILRIKSFWKKLLLLLHLPSPLLAIGMPDRVTLHTLALFCLTHCTVLCAQITAPTLSEPSTQQPSLTHSHSIEAISPITMQPDSNTHRHTLFSTLN